MRRWALSACALSSCTLLLGAQDPPRCGDGIRDPGELCYVIQELSLLEAAEYSTTADFNGDGFADAATGARNGLIEIFLNDGSGKLSQHDVLTAGNGQFTNHIIAGDFDGDGDADLISAHFGFFSVLTNDGAGSFTVSATNPGCLDGNGSSICVGINWAEAGDLDKDGDLDLVLADESSDPNDLGLGAAVWRNDGGVFTHVTNLSFGDNEQAVYIRDLDQDGLPEILIAQGDSNIAIVENIGAPGDISFAPAILLANNNIFADIETLATADFNGDGREDIFAAEGSGELALFLAPSDQSLNLEESLDFSIGGQPRTIITADLDNDGSPDLVVSNQEDTIGLVFLLNDGAANFDVRQIVNDFDGVFGVFPGDLNNDGLPDILATAEEVGPNDLPELVIFLSAP